MLIFHMSFFQGIFPGCNRVLMYSNETMRLIRESMDDLCVAIVPMTETSMCVLLGSLDLCPGVYAVIVRDGQTLGTFPRHVTTQCRDGRVWLRTIA
jgi:hypothetical protein